MIDFRKERKALLEKVKAYFDSLFRAHQFEWRSGNNWVRELDWAQLCCSVGIRKISSGLYLELIGGGGLFARAYHPVFQPDFMEYSSTGVPPASLGGPLQWIDERLDFTDGRFTTLDELERWLPTYRRAFDERVIPELERVGTESKLLDLLLATDWSKQLRLAATQDRRAALVALMLARRSGGREALVWARAELDRIKAQEPDQERPGRWQELQRATRYLETHSD